MADRAYNEQGTMTTRVVGYCRLSKSEDGHGIDVQRRAIEEHCERHGLELLRIEQDDGVSGRSTSKRPGLAAALDVCRSGECDGVVAAKLDRVTRSLLDFARIVEDAQRHSYSLIIIDQGFDLQTPHGKAMAGMLAVFAQYERDMISARTRDALAIVRKNGSRSGRSIGNPSFRPCPEPIAQLIRDLRAEGRTYQSIAAELGMRGIPTLQGGRSWAPNTVRGIALRAA
jgi:DNA invertase Pin-like site-specific DNA recombinase